MLDHKLTRKLALLLALVLTFSLVFTACNADTQDILDAAQELADVLEEVSQEQAEEPTAPAPETPEEAPQEPEEVPEEEPQQPETPAEEPQEPEAPAEEPQEPDAPAEEPQQPEAPAEEPQEPAQEEPVQEEERLDEFGSYSSMEDVVLYIETYGHLPDNFITKNEARDLGWSGGSLEPYAPGCSIGGDRFGNYEGLLPDAKGRKWTECDIDTVGKKSRGAKRVVFSSDGLIYYTDDHYETFTQVGGAQ